MGRKSLILLPALVAMWSCAASELVEYKLWKEWPRDDDAEVRVAGLAAPAAIVLDEAGVPHVRAASVPDLARAAGFAQGRARFFQMDMLRRIARGRVSELVGDQPFMSGTTVDFDLSMRAWGLDRAAARDAAAVDAETRALLDAYAAGVNAAARLYVPFEHRLLDVDPDPWTPEDSFAVGRLVAWSLTHNWHQEASRLLLALHAGWERAEAIYPPEVCPGEPSIRAGAAGSVLPPSVLPELRSMFLAPPPSAAVPFSPGRAAAAPTPRPEAAEGGWGLGLTGGASNAWVVAGDRSASGKPILANDPHLAHLVPSFFFQQHLACPGIDVIGVTVPGIPWVLAGHNERVAWGNTSTVADSADLCVEKADEAVTTEEVGIGVRVKRTIEPRRFKIRRTRNGPALADAIPGLLPSWAPLVTIRWDTGDLGGSMAAILRAATARDVHELRAALSAVAAPVGTFTAADVDGNVALFVVGRVPIREAHRGTFPIPGWDARYDWKAFVPADAMPHAAGSGATVLAHANNLVEPPGAVGPPIQVDSAPSWRVDRIRERIAATGKHTTVTLGAIQRDVKLLRGRALAPVIVAEVSALDAVRGDLSPLERQALEVLATWDFDASAGSAGAAVFQATFREAAVEALADEVDAPALEFILSQRYSTNAVDGWVLDAANPVWDVRGTEAVETRAEGLRRAFGRAVGLLAKSQGTDPALWRWGRLHDIAIRHPFGGKKALAKMVNLPAAEVGGGLDSVWKSHFDLGNRAHPFRAVAGPAWRMVVDLADIRHGRWIVDTGSSGWPGAPHYRDQHAKWLRGEYEPMISDWDEIVADAAGTLTLLPAAPAQSGPAPAR
ncbi:MAG: penicillin acylase family protein [Deltaproteobacteria bacterium]|nr:penicillin acylase family protein [Deltaproteobacteria bacterium]